MRMAMSAPRWIGVPGVKVVLGQASGTRCACRIFSAKVNAIVFSFMFVAKTRGPVYQARDFRLITLVTL